MLKEGTFVKKKYANLLICAVLGWIVAILGGMADSIIAGLFLDSEAVSAVGLISPFASVIYFVALLVCVGIPLMYSITLGAFEVEKSQKIAGMGVIVSVVLGVVMTVLMIIFKDSILSFYGCTGQLYEYASQYYNPLIFLALIEPLVWTIYNLVTYDGDSELILIIDILMAVSNAAISLTLVKSKGISGLAIGTVSSYALGLILTIPHFLKKKNSVHFKLYFNIKDLIKSIKLSSSSSMTTLCVAIIDIVFNKFIIIQFGQDMLPAYTVVNVTMNFASFLYCTMTAGAVFLTIYFGEKNYFAVCRTMKIVHRNMFTLSIAFAALMIFIAPLWPSIYGITDTLVSNASIFAGRVIPATYIFAAIVYNYLAYYVGIDRVVEANIISIAYMLIGPLALAYPLGLIGGFNAMSIGFALTPIFAIAVLFVYCLIKGEAKKLPYLLPEDDKINFHRDIKLEEESILELRDEAGKWLAENNTDSKIINKIELIIEETLLHIKNRNKKTVYCECDLLMNDDRVWLVTKDNGIIFNMLQEADDSLDLGCYVAARAMEKANEKSYTTTISFNRNTYIWNRK